MITTINNKHNKLNVPNKREQNQTCLDFAEREGLRPKGNVPNLRFPEFQGEWEELGLSELLDFKNGLNPKPNKFGKGIKFISVMDILNNAVITYDCIKASVDVTEKELSDFSVEKGDMLFQRSSETLEDVGRANVYMDDKTAVFGGFVIRGKRKGEYDPQYFNYLLRSPFARKRIIPMGAGAQHFNIGQEGLSKVKLHFANIEEQKKIGKMLSLLDERIATQNKIIEDLKKLKSAISHILFSSKCAIHLSDIANVVMGQSPSSNAYNDQGIGMPLVQGNLDISNGKTIPRLYTAEFNQTAEEGNIILTVRAPVGEVAKATKKVCLGRGVCAIIPHEENMSDFIYQYLTFYKFMWRRYEQGSTFTSINGSDVRNIPCPKVRNVSILTLLDRKINIEERVIKLYQSQKQYMLCQMFI